MEGQFIAYGLVFERADVHTGQTEGREKKNFELWAASVAGGVKGGRG